MRELLVKVAREPHEMIFLAVVAGHSIDATANGDVDLGHGTPDLSVLHRERGADGVGGVFETAGNSRLAASRSVERRAHPIKLGGEPRAVAAEGMQLRFKGFATVTVVDRSGSPLLPTYRLRRRGAGWPIYRAQSRLTPTGRE